MKIPRSTQFKALQLQKMPIGEHWTIDQPIVGDWKENWMRLEVSRYNARYNINLKCHKNKDGSITIWHSPEPREQLKSVAFDRLLRLRKDLDELRLKQDYSQTPNQYLEEMFAIQNQIEKTVEELQYNETEPRKKRNGSMAQPLPVILGFYGLTRDIWEKLPAKLRTKKWVQAEIEIKRRNQND